jgi:hypothetical protein
MNRLCSLLLATTVISLVGTCNSKAAPPPTNAPSLIELNDQFDSPQKLSFPATNITLLTIADKKGSEQIAGWIAPLKHRFGRRIDIRGIADVSPVPRMLRGLVRMNFKRTFTYPVMMDWSGNVVNAFTYVPDEANVLVLDRRGRIISRLSGKANEKAVHDLFAVIDQAMGGHDEELSTH